MSAKSNAEKKHWLEDTYSGQHRMDGILVMAGDDILKGLEIPAREIIDLAPTILHLMDIAIPSDMDGQVIKDAITPSYSEKHPVEYRDLQTDKIDKAFLDIRPDQEKKQEIIDLLKGLGYID